MKSTLPRLSALLLMPLAALFPPAAAETVVLDQNHFGIMTHPLPPNHDGLGADSTSSSSAPRGDRRYFTAKSPSQADTHGVPAVDLLRTGKGRLMAMPDAGNFRWRVECRRDRVEFSAGIMKPRDVGKETRLAQPKRPGVAEDGAEETWIALKVLVQRDKLDMRVGLENGTGIPVMECGDSAPIPGGAILPRAGEAAQGWLVSFAMCGWWWGPSASAVVRCLLQGLSLMSRG